MNKEKNKKISEFYDENLSEFKIVSEANFLKKYFLNSFGIGLWILFLFFGLCLFENTMSVPSAANAGEMVSDTVEEITDLNLEDLELNVEESEPEVSESGKAEDSKTQEKTQSIISEQKADPSQPAETSAAQNSTEPGKIHQDSPKTAIKKKAMPQTVAPLTEVLPADAAIIIRISSVREFNEKIEKLTETNFLKLLKTLGKGEYAKQLEPDLPAGAALFSVQNTFQWTAAVPIKRYRKFIELLGVKVNEMPAIIPDGTISVISEKLAVMPFRGYALLAANPLFLDKVQKGEKFGTSSRFTPCAVKNPVMSLEVTEKFINFLVRRGKIGMEEFAPVFTPEMKELQDGNNQLELAEKIFERINESIANLNENVSSARLDFTISENEMIVSGSYLPKAGSRLEALIHDPYQPKISTVLDGGQFLKAAPLYPAFLAGQADISPASAAKLEMPFNRIRHVEYSLMTPPEGGRLAEAWCFLLEVDDSQAFVQEMLIPRAEAVGGQYGANTLGEIGRDMLQDMALRRQTRQLGRGREPRANPDLAAQRGEAIGSWLGGIIGTRTARKEAMKVQDFMGYDLYSSDLIQYTQMLKRIREQEEGTAPPAHFGLGTRPGEMLGTLISGFVNGNANLNMEEMLQGNLAEFSTETPGEPPLIAARNFILLLGPNHLLIVPGNDIILYEAVIRWQAVRDKYLPPEPPKTEEELLRRASIPPYPFQAQISPEDVQMTEDPAWQRKWDSICRSIAAPQNHKLRFASILNTDEARRALNFASQTYQFKIPENVHDAIPENLPPIFAVYTTSPKCGNFFLTLPHEMSRNQFQKLFIQLPALLRK